MRDRHSTLGLRAEGGCGGACGDRERREALLMPGFWTTTGDSESRIASDKHIKRTATVLVRVNRNLCRAYGDLHPNMVLTRRVDVKSSCGADMHTRVALSNTPAEVLSRDGPHKCGSLSKMLLISFTIL